jgi:hypothetical protein
MGWLVYAGVFIHRLHREEGEALTPELERLVGQEVQEDWFSIYQHGHRAGYSHTQLLPQKDGYVVIEELFLRLNFMEEVQDIFFNVQSKLAPDFSLKSFTFRLQAGPIAFRLRGQVQDAVLTLATWMAGQEQSRELPLSGPVYLGSGIQSFLSRQHLRVGDTYRVALFDPTTMSQTPVSLRVAAKETINIQKQDRETFRVDLDFHGVKLSSWMTPYGELLKEEGFLGMTLIRTHEEEALEGLTQVVAVELMREASVVPDQTIDEPRGLKRLRLQLTGITGTGWYLAGDRQRWQWHKGELTVLRETLEGLPPIRIPQNDPRMARYLQPTLLIQSDAPELKSQASTIVGEERDALKAVIRISTWVYENVEKRPTLSIPSALDVWKRRAGDCNEHSVLFAALARAAGIPTRVAAGLLYVDGRFFYHAWNEVNLGKWVAVDALMNQVPADPTHVRLVVGGLESQVKLVRLIGKLGIRVLEYEPHKRAHSP